jgi:predicted acyltransferase
MENTKRLLALDVFRGLTVAFMIVVNNPGSWDSVYPPLLHSAWNGCTPTDLVFPFFMFIIGSAMWYSYKKTGHTLTYGLSLRILRRTVLIYLIGLIISAYSAFTLDLSGIRIMGVLARIALAYAIASFLVLTISIKWVSITTAVILLAYWALLLLFGGNAPFSLEGNFARTFDIAVLGINHIPVFHGVKFDQTGLLSTMPSVANIIFGYLAARLTDTTEVKWNAVKKLFIYGIAGIAAALAWNFIFPINKPLWTSSFVLYTSGFACLFLGALLWIIDIKGYSGWTMPFRVFGMNALFIYILSEGLAITLWLVSVHASSGEKISLAGWIYNSFFLPLAGAFNGSLLYALIFTFLCWLAGLILFYRNIIIKL